MSAAERLRAPTHAAAPTKAARPLRVVGADERAQPAPPPPRVETRPEPARRCFDWVPMAILAPIALCALVGLVWFMVASQPVLVVLAGALGLALLVVRARRSR